MKLKIPSDWKLVWEDAGWVIPDVFGWCVYSDKMIILKKYPWVPRFIYTKFTLPHELGHVFGVCGCDKFHCIMFEGEKVKDQWGDILINTIWEKLASLPFQIFYWPRFCPVCRNVIKSNYLYKENNK